MIRLRPTTLCVTIEEVHCLDLRPGQSSSPRVVCMPSRTRRILGKDAREHHEHYEHPQPGSSVAGQSLQACDVENDTSMHANNNDDEHDAGGGHDVVMTTNEMAPLTMTPPPTRLVRRPQSASTFGYSSPAGAMRGTGLPSWLSLPPRRPHPAWTAAERQIAHSPLANRVPR